MKSKAKGSDSVAIIGGCGHVGLPLGVKFALAGKKTYLVDINEAAVGQVSAGNFPFLESGGDEQLEAALRAGLEATSDATVCENVNTLVFVTGTPVDEHLNPKLSEVLKIFDFYEKYFRPESLIVMRSTLFPGTMEHLYQRTREIDPKIRICFCPERVSQGFALDEIHSLPQIVSAFDEESFNAAFELFSVIAPSIIKLSPLEAEITKLMANSWRYLEFAIANQFYLIAEQNGIDFHRIYQAIKYDYPRANGYPAPGFAAGPCLFKDTMQLGSYFDNQFYLGHSAMLVNEGLATFVVEKVNAELDGSLWGKSVGLLGMTFKPNSDDIRESLSFKVKKGLEFKGAEVKFHDPYLKDSWKLNEVLSGSDALVLCTPHKEYSGLSFNVPMVDVWGFYAGNKIEVLSTSLSELSVVNK